MNGIKKVILIGALTGFLLFVCGITATQATTANKAENSINTATQNQIQVLMQKIIGLMQQLKALLTQQQEQANQNSDNQTDDYPDSDYKTYTNKKYGFEIKYPISDSSDPSENTGAWCVPGPSITGDTYSFPYRIFTEGQITEGDNQQHCTADINVCVIHNQNKLSLNDWIAKYGKYFGYTNQLKQETMVSGVKGIKLGKLGPLPPGGGSSDGTVLLSYGGYIYMIKLNIEEALFILGHDDFNNRCISNANQRYDNMIATFKLID